MEHEDGAMNGRQMWDLAKAASPKDGWGDVYQHTTGPEGLNLRGRSGGISSFNLAAMPAVRIHPCAARCR